jgi:hypothetical protein
MVILQAAMEPATVQQMLLGLATQRQVAIVASAGVMAAVQQLETAAVMVLRGMTQLQQQLGRMVRMMQLQQGRTGRVRMAAVVLVVTMTVLQRQQRQSYKRRHMTQQRMVLRPVMLLRQQLQRHCHRAISSKQRQQQTTMHTKQKMMAMQMMRLLAMTMTMIVTLLTRSTCRRSGTACAHAAPARAG